MKPICIFLSLCLFGCKPCRQITETVYRTQVREVVRDSVVVIPPDTSWLTALLECDSLGKVRIAEILTMQPGYRIHPPAPVIIDNILTVTAEVDSFSVYLKLKDRYIESEKTTTHTEYIHIKQRGFFWWVGLAACITSVATVGWLVIGNRKKIF